MENKKINSDFLQNIPIGWEFVSAEISGLSCDSYELMNTPYFIEIKNDKFCLSSFSGVSFKYHDSFTDIKTAMHHGEQMALQRTGCSGDNIQE